MTPTIPATPAPRKGPALDLDLNRNGVPDWREPWLYQLAWTVIRFFIRRHGSPALRSTMTTVDELATELGSKLDASSPHS